MTAPSSSQSLRTWAEEVARELLADVRPRLDHVLAVGEKARKIAFAFGDATGDVFVAAAYLHDIGYAPSLVETGYHQVDGGHWLCRQGHHELAGLVAHHSFALRELELRGCSFLLEPFEEPPREVADALAYCDVTTSPTGVDVTLGERIDDVLERYGEKSPVYQALLDARDDFQSAVERTRQRLAHLNAASPSAK